MGTVLFILVLLGALLALVAGVAALRAWLSFRRARIDLQRRLSEDVARLAARTGELEESVAALDARTQQLPVHISRLQENLDTLQILTRTLATSLRQAQRVLSYSGLKTFSAARIADLLPARSDRTKQ
jgi:seryl-tRNA(Sec) selenium transferase